MNDDLTCVNFDLATRLPMLRPATTQLRTRCLMLPSITLCLGNCNIRLHLNSKLKYLLFSYRAESTYNMNSNAMYLAAASYDHAYPANAYYTTTYATPYKAEARQYNAQPK